MTSHVGKSVIASTLTVLLVVPAVADAQVRRAVPRPRPAVVGRSQPSVAVGVGYRPYYRPYYYRPYYYPWNFSFAWYGGYSFYGVGYPYYGYPYYGAYQYPYPYYGRGYYDLSSSLRLQVSPRETEVYIDGYYAGTVDSFDGMFQRLHLEPGDHELELFLPGHRSFTQRIYLQPVSTFRVRHTMAALGAGEPEPQRPSASARPPSGGSTQAGPERPQPRGQRPPDRPVAPRARNDRDRAAVEAEFGSFALRIQPGDAVVLIDGERWEGAKDQDRLVVELSAGTHTVEIRKDGYRTYITDITVRRGETTPLNVSLTRQ